MEENKNTFIFKKNLVIEKERETLSIAIDDEMDICGGELEAYDAMLKSHEYNEEKIVEIYSSKTLGENTDGYVLCEKLMINGNPYNFVGYKVQFNEKLSKRWLYLY